jgi:hypothetical protein
MMIFDSYVGLLEGSHGTYASGDMGPLNMVVYPSIAGTEPLNPPFFFCQTHGLFRCWFDPCWIYDHVPIYYIIYIRFVSLDIIYIYIICTCIHSDIRFLSQKVVHWIYGATAFVSVLGEVCSHWIHRKGGYFTVDVICTANAFALYYLSTL